ncbi:rhomboid family intramembrane serine protease [Ideonella sp. DXS22W]|uniref:Rhomboid family intramembrane serine protease n=1 Tax=Pseudaquabacterium inlustre TaxID=2984192 RepID=A0ABU9CAM4_9BURK
MLQLPPVTKALLLACIAVFCVQSLLPILPIGAYLALWPLSSGHFWPWQVLSYGFLHGDFTHLLFNMLGMWMFGRELESLWGGKRYAHLLLASLVTAAIAQLLVTLLIGSRAPTVGASGALYGLLLAYGMVFRHRMFDLVGLLPMALMLLPGDIFQTLGLILFVLLLANRQMVPIPPVMIPAMTMVAIFGGIELFMGLMHYRDSGIAHFAHLGGMLGAWLLMRHWRNGGGTRGKVRRIH